MGFGFAKSFVIFLGLSILLAIGTKNPMNGVVLMGIYAAVKIVWGILTHGRNRI